MSEHGEVVQDLDNKPMDTELKKDDGDELVAGESPVVISDGPPAAVATAGEFTDPAILAVGLPPTPTSATAPQPPEFRYSRDELIKLRGAPMSQKKPEYLDAAYQTKTGIWDPESWYFAVKAQEGGPGAGGLVENGTAGPPDRRTNDPENHRRRPGDPRERIRKEQDGIVLSPQRRSFNSGCFVPVTRPNRPHSPLGGGGGVIASVVGGVKGDAPRDLSGGGVGGVAGGPGARRIGSGRILPWDYQEKAEPDNEQQFGYRGPRERRDTNDQRDERFDRRSFGRDFEMKPTDHRDLKDGRGGGHLGGRNNNNNNNRYNNRRISNERREEEEPEWFSSGPISQNDTIELRGFDDNERVGGPTAKRLNNNNIGKSTTQQQQQQKKTQSNSNKAHNKGSEQLHIKVSNKENVLLEKDELRTNSPKDGVPKKGDAGADVAGETSSSFNFEDILKCESIPGLLSNGVESGDAAGSRFSRWFKREKSPPTNADDQHHHSLIKNLLGGGGDGDKSAGAAPLVSIPQPGDAESYFAPISPQASSTLLLRQQLLQQQQLGKGMNLMEMLQRGNKQAAAAVDAKSGGGAATPGKIMCLEELEARMKPNDPHVGAKAHAAPKPEEDINAFKRLFSGASHGGVSAAGGGSSTSAPGAGGSSQQKPMSIMEMLSLSQQQDEAARLANQRMNSANLPPHLAPTDLTYKLQQVQQQVQQQQSHVIQQQQQKFEMLSKLMNATAMQQQQAPPPPMQRTSPLQEMGVAQSRELLNRPEAQAILQGLKRGDITPAHLFQQLANPAMQPRHRELLQTIIKMQQQAAAAAAVAAAASLQQQQQASIAVAPSSPVPPAAQPPVYQQQNNLRLSPLPSSNNAYCVSPILATSPNTLSVPAMHQRIPSPRELQVHTQNIMQRALIKKKLEEQQENYRKKHNDAHNRGTSPGVKTASPTPLAFTPTAVLRKMTADKDDGSKDGNKLDKSMQQQQGGRALTGMRTTQPTSSQQQVQNWNTQQQYQSLKQPGRPIVKANNNYQQQATLTAQQDKIDQFLQQQHRMAQQQAQQRKNQQTFGIAATAYQQQQQQSQQSQQQQQQQYPQLSQQQLRAQHQNVRAQHQQQSPAQQQQQQQPPAYHQHNANQWVLQNQSFDGRQVGRGGIDGDLSPTSNQLARWFSPELLERARKGKLAGNALPQHAITLEDIERQTAAPVGNN